MTAKHKHVWKWCRVCPKCGMLDHVDERAAAEVEAIRKIVASDPATHHLNAETIAARLHTRGIRATRSS